MPLQVKRLLIVFVLFIASFLVARYFLKPKHFGELGHYRTESLAENEVRDLKHVGMKTCEMCHDTVMKVKDKGPHKLIQCETCHGAGYLHVKEASETSAIKDNKMLKPEGREFCGRCHEKNIARNPKVIKQVDLKEHNPEDVCITCHQPHMPLI